MLRRASNFFQDVLKVFTCVLYIYILVLFTVINGIVKVYDETVIIQKILLEKRHKPYNDYSTIENLFNN